MLALLLSCTDPQPGQPRVLPEIPQDTGAEPSPPWQAPGFTPAEAEAPCDAPRQAWAPEELAGHTPWFLGAGERVLLGTVHDSEPAHVLELVDGELVDVGAPAATETAIWAIVEASDGNWYGGTYPNAHLVREGEDLGALWDGATVAFTLATAGDWVYAGLGPERSAIAGYRISDGELRVFEGSGTSAYGEVHLGDDGHVYGRIDGRILRFEEGSAVEVEAFAREADPQAAGFVLDNMSLDEPAGGALSALIRDPETWQPRSLELSVEGRGLDVHALAAKDGLLVGGTLLPNEIFSHEGAFEHRGHVGDGEMYSMKVDGDVVWMASYPDGVLWRWEPELPWELGTNPSGVELGEGHLRPLALELGEHEAVWVGSVAGYGVEGGALARYDDDGVTNYREPFAETGVAALAWDQDTRWLAVSADGLQLWDPEEEEIAHTFEGLPAPWVMEAMGGRLYALTWTMELLVVDLRTLEVVYQEETGLGNSRRHALAHKKNKLWGAADWGLYTIDPHDLGLSQEVYAPDGIEVSGAYGDDGVYFASGSEIWFMSLATLGIERLGEPVEGAALFDQGASGDDLLALLKAGDTLAVVSVEPCPAEPVEVLELLEDGGFEEGGDAWQSWGGDWGEVELVSDPVHEGEAALKVGVGAVGGFTYQDLPDGLEGTVTAGAWIWLPAEGAPESAQLELYLYGTESYAWGQTSLDLSTWPREEWIQLGPFDGSLPGDQEPSYVHLGFRGAEGTYAVVDGISMRSYD